MNSIQNYGNLSFQSRKRIMVPVKKAVKVSPDEAKILEAKINKLQRRIKYVSYQIKECETRMLDTYQKGLNPFIGSEYNKLCGAVQSLKDKINNLREKLYGLN